MVLVFQDVASDQHCLPGILVFLLSSSPCGGEIGRFLWMYILTFTVMSKLSASIAPDGKAKSGHCR